MQIIREGRPDVIKIWGRAPLKDTKYRLIRYHVKTECENGVLLLNTVTGELILLSPEEAIILEALPTVVPPEMQDLIVKRFLVPVDYDELKAVNQLRKLLRKLDCAKGITGYSILPTTSCNARCFYCFESDYPHYTMTEETADQVAEFIHTHCEQQQVSISWFGGEPTVGEKRIDQICDRLTEKGVIYTSSMYSNGYLFSQDLVQKAVEKWHLRRIQITLDGTEQIYNQTKSYVGVRDNPYYRVLSNIGLLLDAGIYVIVRMNLDFHNYEDLKALINELAERYAGKGNFEAYVHELFEDEGFTPVSHSQDERSTLMKRLAYLNAYISEKGLNRSVFLGRQNNLPNLKIHFCQADNLHSLLINPLGQFGKCDHIQFDRFVGDINNGLDLNSQNGIYWLEPDYLESCHECALYPFCAKVNTCPPIIACSTEARLMNLQITEARIKQISKQAQ